MMDYRYGMPETERLRRYDTADSASLAALWHRAWHDGHAAVLPEAVVAERTPDRFAIRLDALAPGIVVADVDGRIAGFVAVVDNEVDQLFVAAAYRGSGIADRLLAAAEADLARRGVELAVLQCLSGNWRALRFYARAGWRDTGARPLPLWTPDGRVETASTHLFVKVLARRPQ